MLLVGDDRPGGHGAHELAVGVEDWADEEVEDLGADLNLRGDRQCVLPVGEDALLVCGVLVEDVDRAADDVVGLAREMLLDGPQGLERAAVHVLDDHVRSGEHHVRRSVLHHLQHPLDVGLSSLSLCDVAEDDDVTHRVTGFVVDFVDLSLDGHSGEREVDGEWEFGPPGEAGLHLCGVLMETVDRTAEQLVDGHPEPFHKLRLEGLEDFQA